jgi:SOS-response transcriptional repressor LexA
MWVHSGIAIAQSFALTFLEISVHMNIMGIIDRRLAVLDFIRDFCADKGLMSVLRRTVQRSRGAERSVTVTGMVHANLVHVPFLGTIPAGYPSDQEQQSDRCVSIDEDTLQLPKNARTFALEVRGDSMIDAHIVEGDIVIMELRDPTHRDIVAALIDGETTLKRFLVHKGKPFLRAENSRYPDLIPAHELVIQGVFRALLRVDKRRL